VAGGKQGQRLSQAEVEEYLSFRNLGLAAPEKFDAVVFDNAAEGQEQFYRYKTAEEEKADAESAERAVKAVEAHNAMVEKTMKAAGVAAEPVVPAAPASRQV